ncbi:MAG: thioredoxin family protein [Pelagibacteraceae bacterium]|jgi:peroxiredoxin|nr:thioredoxin family protein [Pelagibacteraceae bacterium]HJO13696.1 thioredoxin family protein [Alphaproteobacteria bacterium]MBO6466566.1 thioredoxin family protein [Pelagibacteraceae bacterium]MBO6467425.1 thioredoxin family protein [Pelagibacteraceae bacterium]MBO6470543.1 thioredoxin family protein [Pelagibacteraceae bacterium]|tara:strand:+ start:120 stop:677 length:558 start_codon:yes stop_codon:yes gene_type:complete
MPVKTPELEIGIKAEDFNLLSVDDRKHTLQSLKGDKGTVIVFICNHCPYVIAIAERLSFEARELKKIGVSTIAIMSNDVENYPEDSFENMKKFSEKYNFEFSYLYDSTQEVAKKFNAVCTPDFFGFNNKLELHYRGRIDSETMNNNNKEIKRELFYAMKMIVLTNKGPTKQMNSFGCSIKWKKNE